MFNLEELLKKLHIEYKKMDHEGNYTIYKLNENKNLLLIENSNNQFKLSRDWFDYLDFNSLPYAILLMDKAEGVLYYLSLEKKVNWVKSCFETCDKDELFLGKQILNSKISVEDLCKKLYEGKR